MFFRQLWAENCLHERGAVVLLPASTHATPSLSLHLTTTHVLVFSCSGGKMTNPSWRLGYFCHCSFFTSPFFFAFFYSAFVKTDSASCSCLRRAEQRLIQHYQVRPATKWTRQGVKSLLASV